MAYYLSSKLKDHQVEIPELFTATCSEVCCTLQTVAITINVNRTEAVNQGGMAICHYNVLDCLNTILIGGWDHQQLGEFLIIYACIRQNARATNRALSLVCG